MPQPVTSSLSAQVKAHVAKIRALLKAMEKARPDDGAELLRLSALVSYELQHITALNK
jgi:hypothetical protein